MRLCSPTTFRYRVCVHGGWPGEARVAVKYLDYVQPPKVEAA